jgi:L-2-hydroxyglutarate oxidase LhgO
MNKLDCVVVGAGVVGLAVARSMALAGREVVVLEKEAQVGTHATNDLGGGVRFGPDVRWVESIDYDFDDSCRGEFVEAIQRYYPALEPGKLVPGYTGIRPKLVGLGKPPMDFRIEGAGEHGVPGLVNLFGMESPGLTACLAIGDYVRDVALSSG